MLGSLTLPCYITVYLHYIKKKNKNKPKKPQKTPTDWIPPLKYMYINHQTQGDLDLLGASKYHCSIRNN